MGHPSERRPRSTPFWREQRNLLQKALADVPDDPLIRAAWGHLTLLTADALGLSVDLIDEDDEPRIVALRRTLGSEGFNPFTLSSLWNCSSASTPVLWCTISGLTCRIG
jgi:hypothetical protein